MRIRAAGHFAVNDIRFKAAPAASRPRSQIESELTPPANGTFGNSGRNIFRGPDFTNWDFSMSKNTKLGEHVTLQLRAEFFNILNHPNFTGINNNLAGSNPGLAAFTPDLGASNPVLGSGGSRHIQLGAKFIW